MSRVKRRYKRLVNVLLLLTSMSIGVYLIFLQFKDNLVFFYTPSELAQHHIAPGKFVRIGGIVKAGSIISNSGENTTIFAVTDEVSDLTLHYKGVLPPMFREGQGVVAEGELDKQGVFTARRLLTKHDENYVPPEMEAVLKAREQQGNAP